MVVTAGEGLRGGDKEETRGQIYADGGEHTRDIQMLHTWDIRMLHYQAVHPKLM